MYATKYFALNKIRNVGSLSVFENEKNIYVFIHRASLNLISEIYQSAPMAEEPALVEQSNVDHNAECDQDTSGEEKGLNLLPTDGSVAILKAIQQLSAKFDGMNERFDRMDDRFDRIERRLQAA
jgi:hypothetical protein